MPNKQTTTDQIVWLLLQAATVQDEIKKIKQQLQVLKEYKELQEHTLKRSCQAEAIRTNDVCRTPPTNRIGEVHRSRSSRPSPTTPPTPPARPPVRSPSAPPSARAIFDALLPLRSPQHPLSPLTSMTIDEILEWFQPERGEGDLERERK